MSVTTSIAAVKPPDATWEQHKAVWDACEAAGVEIPDATADFFDGENPDPIGVVVYLGSVTYPTESDCVREYRTEHSGGVEIEIAKLPSGTKWLRVVQS